MKLITSLIGLALILLGIYFLGSNILFTTSVDPYWWRGISADASVLFLTSGVIGLFALPKNSKSLGWILIGISILLIFVSSRAILQPTSLWQFFLSVVSLTSGYKLLTFGKL